MRKIVLVSSKPHADVETLVVNEIEHLDMLDSLRELRGDFDALVLTSKNAAQSLQQNIKKYPQFEYLKKIPAYAIGESSAQTLGEHGFCVEYVGKDSHGSGFADEIIPMLRGKKVLYFRAKKIVSKLDERLQAARIILKQIVAYENKRNNTHILPKPKPKSILIFTAPSHYLSFVQNFSWDGSYIAIAIGLTTFSVFDEEIEAFVSPRQDIQSCIHFAKEIALRLP
ncbi:uroporphyrinogen-III synthase [Helicobacter mustelae]|uniref:Uroporphyrinogen-III synthase n=1 Tax=Helicobacter mustelae (strain ATCC 43772 / CCUG 25715 / CIP 103759 / LMG 18044 / NCTC 12198 / R85-136P) TaxID=679897 RepID=D3UIE8_HELM1|nr:uroporphyrinogen-III synthase [Helicobacter mustelae]CBG40271.1 putative Uroporphyrinogen-III synthase, HemD [Helicobacter mustelae 12198]SQH71770.1 uroporphyrinogen-III synthase [Helicobacter mustelae]STP12899.1 uroporphyrinogen-III synthase [Helicobacter mustelae]